MNPRQLTKSPVSPVSMENYRYIQENMNLTDDLNYKEISFSGHHGIIVFLESLVDKNKIHHILIDPLYEMHEAEAFSKIAGASSVVTENVNETIQYLLNGCSILFLEGRMEAYTVETQAVFVRSIMEPTSEKILKGSHEGFVENLYVNLYLIRRRLVNAELTIKYFTLGKETQTRTALLYLNNIADEKTVQILEDRINKISVDSMINPGNMEELIEESPYSFFPQALNTERPDRVLANLMEGRIALMSGDSSSVLILPVSFFAFLQAPDDYNSRWYLGTFFRWIRIFGLLIAIFLPGIYISMVSFQYEVFPTAVILPVKISLENIPFPPLIEALIMEVALELLREAGIRVPSPIGQTIGVVGGLIIGDAVVRVGLVSNSMVTVVALTAIASFVIPSSEMSTSARILRFPVMILSALIGFFGLICAFMLILVHLCKLDSLGKPYFYPLAPLKFQGLKDALIRIPFWKMKKRPDDTNPKKQEQVQNTPFESSEAEKPDSGNSEQNPNSSDQQDNSDKSGEQSVNASSKTASSKSGQNQQNSNSQSGSGGDGAS